MTCSTRYASITLFSKFRWTLYLRTNNFTSNQGFIVYFNIKHFSNKLTCIKTAGIHSNLPKIKWFTDIGLQPNDIVSILYNNYPST